MTDQTKKIRRGDTIEVRISGGGEEVAARAEERRRRGAFTDAPDDDLFVFRKKGIRFFDLGTRKNEDGTFRDVTQGHLVSPITDTNVRDYYHTALLTGFDPDGCLQIPQEAEALYFDASFLPADTGGDIERNLVGRPARRPYVFELVTGSNVPSTKWAKGSLPYKSANPYLSVESSFYYNAFITQDDAFPYYGVADQFYMVTGEPDDQADNVPYTPANGDRVYLTPVMTLYSTGTTPNHLYFGRRLPVLPSFAPQADLMAVLGEAFDFGMGATVTSMRASAALWSAAEAYYTANFPQDFWDNIVFRGGIFDTFHPSMIVDQFVADYDSPPRSWLAAVIARGGDRFYVWRNYVTGFAGFRYAPYPAVFRRRSKIYAP